MIGSSVLLALAIGAQDVLGGPVHVRTSYSVKESHYVPQEWSREERAPASKMLDLQIGVKQGDFAALERHLNEGTFSCYTQLTKARLFMLQI